MAFSVNTYPHSSLSPFIIFLRVIFFLFILCTALSSLASSSVSNLYASGSQNYDSDQKTSLSAQTPTATVGKASTAGWKTYRNEKDGFKISYPKGSKIIKANGEIRISLPFTPRTTLLEKYLIIKVKESSPEECSNPGQTIVEQTGTVDSNGIEFKKEVGTEGAAGSIYQSIGYSTIRGSRCFGLNFVLHSVNPGNMDNPPPAFNEKKEMQIFDQMLSTFQFISKQ